MALLPINKSDKVSKSRIAVQQIDLHKNAISGDVIDGGTITNFNSSGIQDQADSINLTVKNDVIEILSDLNVKGTIRVENLEYVQAQVPKLNVTKAVMVDHNEVLWKDRLGKSVTKSHLSELGILKNLQVRNTFYVSVVLINTGVSSCVMGEWCELQVSFCGYSNCVYLPNLVVSISLLRCYQSNVKKRI